MIQLIMKLTRTNILEKFSASFINAVIVFVLSVPFYIILKDITQWKIATIGLFFLYNLYFYLLHNNRCLGMNVIDTHWSRKYSVSIELAYILLYTLSFSTLFIWVFLPFDMFLINMLLQTICIKYTGTTIHGMLCGGMYTVKKKDKSYASNHPLTRFVGYNLMNIITFCIDIAIVWFLTEIFHFHYLVSIIIGFATITILNYTIGRTIIFKGTRQNLFKGYAIAFSVAISTLIVILGFTWLLVNWVKLHYLVARIIAAIIAGIWNFFLDSKLTFKIKIFQ